MHKAQVGADIIRPKEERRKKKEEWWAGHPHPILRHNAPDFKAQGTAAVFDRRMKSLR